MESAIRFSQNSPQGGREQHFISVDVTNRSFKLCRTDAYSTRGPRNVEYDVVATSGKVPPFRAFDWHPHPDHENLVAVGQSSGEATLINLVRAGEIDPGPLPFQIRSQRPCNAVSLSSEHLLAAGLDRVRTDFCLNVWDFSQRMSTAITPKSPILGKGAVEPLHKLAAGDAITSLKFFPTSPLHLIAGSKSQWVRLYDLRESGVASNSGLQFNTRCVHNLAIDPRDENFIASCFPGGDSPAIALWDRRMMARGSVTTSYSMHEGRQPEHSLELKNVIDTPGTIWSLRFSKSRRGCLGVLSSTGQLKVYEMGKDSVVEEFRSLEENESEWEVQLPQEVFLDQSQEIGKTSPGNGKGDEKKHVISFDFTTSQDDRGQPCLITLNGDGEIKILATSPKPEPTLVRTSFVMHGNAYIRSNSGLGSLTESIQAIKAKAEPLNPQRQAFSEARAKGQTADRKSSFENQTWRADLGYYESSSSILDLLSLTSLAHYRCQNGYMLDPAVNKKLTGHNNWLSGFWSWCSWAQQLHKSSALIQDNLDLSYLGVHTIWMEDLPPRALLNRSLGPSQYQQNVRLSKTIEALARRLQLPANRHISTEYPFNRQLCLYISNLAWTDYELDTWTITLASNNKQSKAAFLALISNNRPLAIRALKSRGSTQTHHFIALAISTSNRHKPRQPVSTQDQASLDSDDDSSASSTASTSPSLRHDLLTDTLATTTEPFARALLTFLATNSWPAVLASVTSLPIRYRLALALRHLDDKALTSWISQTSSAAVENGDVEGISLVGLGTGRAVKLLRNYAGRFGDVQTSICALAGMGPRYLRGAEEGDGPLRVYEAMRQRYRAEIMSWGGESMLERVRFDVACARVAREGAGGGEHGVGGGKVEPPQVRLVCQACSGGWAHHEVGVGKGDGGLGGEEKGGKGVGEKGKQAQQQAGGGGVNGMNAAMVAATGTVCPSCGRKMSRCGVCDGYLGQEDASFMKWYGKQTGEHKDSVASAVVTEKMAGSVGTIISAEGRKERDRQKGSAGSKGSVAAVAEGIRGLAIKEEGGDDDAQVLDEEEEQLEAEIERLRKQDEMMARFTVVCVKCSHGFHYSHARKWFDGDPEAGTGPHRWCPVASCNCFCWDG